MTDELAPLRARVAVLEAREEIRSLRNRFHEYVNTNRWDEIGGLFADNAVLDYATLGQAGGRSAIAEYFGSMPRRIPTGPGELPFVRQFIHGHTVDVDPGGETASGTSSLFATPVYDGRSFLFSGAFADRYVRLEGEWLFASVTLDIWYSVPLEGGWAQPDRNQMTLERP